MQWFHRSSSEWLDARRNCLTATDIKEILPVTKTGRKRTVDTENYLKILAKKLAPVSEDDCFSTGAAARGHVLEPWAIETFNNNSIDLKFFHWDDVIVTRENHEPLRLAFSPDAINIKQEKSMGVITEVSPEMKHLAEVKSYYPERHLVCGYTDKMELEERWQVATAMTVCETIEDATIIFYNPSMDSKMFTVTYTREDLEEEMKLIVEAEKNWLDFVENFYGTPANGLITEGIDESDIIASIIELEDLNPEGFKSVVL